MMCLQDIICSIDCSVSNKSKKKKVAKSKEVGYNNTKGVQDICKFMMRDNFKIYYTDEETINEPVR